METETKPETNTAPKNWMEKELADNVGKGFTGEKLPSLKLEENKISEVTIDFSKPFEKWNGTDKKGNPVTKAIIPLVDVKDKGTKKNFWLNVQNPLYNQLLKAGKDGQTTFKIIQVGNQAGTKYNLVTE